MPEQKRIDVAVIKVDGSPMTAALYGRLMLVHVEESVHLPDSFALHFDDPHFELFDEDKFRLGTRIEVAFRAEDDIVVVTSGEVTAVSVETGTTGRHELVVSGLDLTHRLARGPKTRTFVKMTDSDIASRIAGEYGLGTDIDPVSQAREYVLQAGETDFAFLKRLCSRIGYDFWIAETKFFFKHKPAGRAKPYQVRWGENLHSFSVRFASADMCDEVVVKAWNPVDKRAITGRSTSGDPGTDAPAADQMASAARRSFGRVTRTAGQFPADSQVEADAIAASLLLRASGGAVVLRGEAVGNPWLGAGDQVALDRVGTRLAGNYRVTSVTHTYGADRPYTVRFVCGGKDAADMADLVASSAADLGRKGWGSLVIGLVTNNDDGDRLGRVKVKFPTLSDADESAYARLCTPGGGAQRGLQWIPEVGDEVLVGFELDDKTRPMILGGLWSRKDKPPQPDVTQGGKTTVHLMASRKNHRVVLTDDPKSAVDLTLGDAQSALHLEKSESKLNGEQKLSVTGATIEIKATQKLVIEAPQIEISARSELKVSGKPIRLN